MLLYAPLVRMWRMSPSLTTRALGSGRTGNHRPSLSICRPGVSSTCSSTVRPRPSVCGVLPVTSGGSIGRLGAPAPDFYH
jgi:hypothetical protein